MYIKQCDRCKDSIELQEELKHEGFLCNNCVSLWKEEEKQWVGKITYPELGVKFTDFINCQNTTLK